MNIIFRFPLLIFLLNILVVFQASSAPKLDPRKKQPVSRNGGEGPAVQPSSTEVLSSTLAETPDEISELDLSQEKPNKMSTTMEQLESLKNSLPQGIQQKKSEEFLKSFKKSQDAILMAYQLREYFFSDMSQKMDFNLRNDLSKSLNRIIYFIEQNSKEAFDKLQRFQQIENSSDMTQYQLFRENAEAAFAESQNELKNLQHEISTRTRSVTNASDATTTDDASLLSDSTNLEASAKANLPIFKEDELDDLNTLIEQLEKETPWYLCTKKGNQPMNDLTENDKTVSLPEETSHKPTSTFINPTKTNSRFGILQENENNEDLTAISEQSSSFISNKPDLTKNPSLNLKKNSSLKESKAPEKADTESKEEVEKKWKEEFEKDFPFDSFDLEKHNYIRFQDDAALKASRLNNDPNYAYLFIGISKKARENFANLTKQDFRIHESDSEPLRRLKEFIKKSVNEEYYSQLLRDHIASRKKQQKALQELLEDEEKETVLKQKSAAKKSKRKKK